jgi:hypothetical protein
LQSFNGESERRKNMKVTLLLTLLSCVALASSGLGFVRSYPRVTDLERTAAGGFPAATATSTSSVVIDFDNTADRKALDVSLTGRLVANSYLAGFDMTVSDVTRGTQVAILDLRKQYEGQAIKASSGNNALGQIGSNDPVSFTINFKSPLQAIEFTRPPLIAGPTGITFPGWRASALDTQGRVLDEAGERGGGYYSDTPAKVFMLKGPGIQALRFDSNNGHFAAFSSAIIDDLTLVK